MRIRVAILALLAATVLVAARGFVTDGACMTSSACQNPSLTYMALTARACAYAVEEVKRLNL